MSGLSGRIKQLDEELLALGEDSMLLEEFDGFIAGLLACPELIMPAIGFQSSGMRTARTSSRPSRTSTMPTGLSVSSWSTTTASRAH